MELRATSPALTSDTEVALTSSSPLEQGALLRACRAVLRPLAQLAVARGLPFTDVAEVLKQSFVEAARAAHPGVLPHRAVSRISTTTGLNRREVTRLMQRRGGEGSARTSPATQAFTRWLTDPAFTGEDGVPSPLPPQGPAPSFESLAHSVTRDVHPRTLLEELSRLGLARVDEDDGRVHLVNRAFVPRADLDRMLAFLGANVGDHLAAAVANVLSDGRRHFEQALFADELSDESLDAARGLISRQWQELLHTLAPALQALIDADKAEGRPAGQRLRIGLFAFTDAMDAPAGATAARPASTPTSIRKE
ncbi:DUF6502 family protein [Ramlibacter alkalitolerans]|uniref:Uncharacterized protein n=1 Tax=Ramlibacter alkalitolerans TaxID=2039631 RepID=A0ABS1JKJ5_9BURK|nr:DUF6502 family protein [Ramlibacter alkalitolerans]MBL0424753.1 hypothetical protein [Ramlibacter alkalitolerans]